MMLPATGVYFRKEDYASFSRRLLVDLIDTVFLTVLSFVAAFVISLVLPYGRRAFNLMFVSVFLICWIYMVLLKRSRGGTLGYRIGRVRIVGFDGQRPGIWALTLRFLFIPWGFVNWFIDYGWMSSDPHRQGLRDKLARTYVVNVNAEPAGTAAVSFRYYDILGYNFLFQEIDR